MKLSLLETENFALLSWLSGLNRRKYTSQCVSDLGSYIKQKGQEYQKLSELGLAPGMKLFLTGVKFTKKKGFGQFSLAAYWKRKYRGKGSNEGWYIVTNLKSKDSGVKGLSSSEWH